MVILSHLRHVDVEYKTVLALDETIRLLSIFARLDADGTRFRRVEPRIPGQPRHRSLRAEGVVGKSSKNQERIARSRIHWVQEKLWRRCEETVAKFE